MYDKENIKQIYQELVEQIETDTQNTKKALNELTALSTLNPKKDFDDSDVREYFKMCIKWLTEYDLEAKQKMLYSVKTFMANKFLEERIDN